MPHEMAWRPALSSTASVGDQATLRRSKRWRHSMCSLVVARDRALQIEPLAAALDVDEPAEAEAQRRDALLERDGVLVGRPRPTKGPRDGSVDSRKRLKLLALLSDRAVDPLKSGTVST